MSDYILDWATADADGSNSVLDTGGGSAVSVIVETPSNLSANGEFVYSASKDGLYSSYPDPSDPAEINMKFSEEVSNVTFDIKDIDGNGNYWDDIVEIFAYDASGARMDVVFSGLDGQTTTAYTIEGESPLSGQPITVSIAGPVAKLSIVFDNGPDDNTAGWISVGDIGFDTYVPPCFARGTMIETNRGETAIEFLAVGDLVRTADHGFQPIRWIGATTVSGMGKSAPILVKKGALGNVRDLRLSPAHRVMLQNWQAEVLFGSREVLASAASLVNDHNIIVQKTENIEYFHLMFDRHEIIFSEGAATESFHPGEVDLSTMAKAARAEIYALFPELEAKAGSFGPSARETIHANEAALFCA